MGLSVKKLTLAILNRVTRMGNVQTLALVLTNVVVTRVMRVMEWFAQRLTHVNQTHVIHMQHVRERGLAPFRVPVMSGMKATALHVVRLIVVPSSLLPVMRMVFAQRQALVYSNVHVRRATQVMAQPALPSIIVQH
jgi:hypothetical protein